MLVAAPAGFGKTTLLAQWLASSPVPRTTAWVTLDPADEDPVRLWTYLAAALERAGCPLGPDPAAFVAANAGEIETRVLPWLLTSLAAMPEDVVIVLDDFHFVREQACHDQMAFLVEHLPPQCHVVIATRSDPGLRLGRLRASGQLGEVRAADLAFSVDEATSPADAAGGPTVESPRSPSSWTAPRDGRRVSTSPRCRCRGAVTRTSSSGSSAATTASSATT